MRALVAPAMSAEAFTAVVRVYADRVNDDVRRLGATPAEAAEIVEESALDVLEQVRHRPAEVGDVVGRWFNQARILACRLVDADDRPAVVDPDASADAPEGLIRDTDLDLAARRGLAAMAPRDRMALLLRDAYELPESATATALELDVASTRALVERARRRFAEVTSATSPEDGALLLRGLAILALPDHERDVILGRVARSARAALPAEADLAPALADDDDERRGPSWLTIALSMSAALVLGSLTGVVTSADGSLPTSSASGLLPEPDESFDVRKNDPAFLSPSPSASPSPSPPPSPSPSSTSTSTSDPSPTAEASASPTAVTGPPAITLSPRSGPDCTPVQVSGRNFTPGRTVRVRYQDPLGRTTPSGGSTAVGPDGRFLVQFDACDPNRLPGPHQVTARAGTEAAQATFTATS